VATKKQRRRREKEKRHDYEIVYVDDEGNELEPDEVEARAPARRSSGSSSRGPARSSRSGGRWAREPQPPSWRRAAKRGALFAPAFVAVVLLLDRKHGSIASAAFTAIFLLVAFVPFSYVADSFVWRAHQRRTGGRPAPRR
jgi:hypothetical protein